MQGDGFFKRGKIWWFRTDPITGKQASSGKRDIESARLEYRERARLATNPEYQPTSRAEQSLNHWAVKFLEHKTALKAAGTASFYEKKLGHIVRILGADTPITLALRPSQIDSYVAQRMAEGTRATTIRKEIGAARTLARFAGRRGAYHGRAELLMPSELADDYEPGKRFLTRGELLALLAELPEHRRPHVALAVAIGCRFSETFRVLPEDVDTETWQVHVRGTKTKGAKGVVPVAPPFRELLGAALPHLPVRRWLNSNMKRDLARACRAAGIAPVTSNDLRRTHGSWLAEAGVSDEHIGKVLRHTDGRMARRVYGQLKPAKLGALLEAQTSATILQQRDAAQEVSAGENEADPDTSEEEGQRIENPRVGGSTPSRDTEENKAVRGDTAGPSVRSASQSDANSRNVRNDSATPGWWGPAPPPQVAGDFSFLREVALG